MKNLNKWWPGLNYFSSWFSFLIFFSSAWTTILLSGNPNKNYLYASLYIYTHTHLRFPHLKENTDFICFKPQLLYSATNFNYIKLLYMWLWKWCLYSCASWSIHNSFSLHILILKPFLLCPLPPNLLFVLDAI